jgi:hypothetical protein
MTMNGLVRDQESRAIGTWRDDVPVAVVAAGGAAAVWVAARVLGVELAVHSGSGTREVGLVAVLVTATVVTLAAGGLLHFLDRRTAGAGRLWTGLALAALAVSLAGPAGAATLSAGLALAAMHLVVGGVVIVGLRRRLADRDERDGRVA